MDVGGRDGGWRGSASVPNVQIWHVPSERERKPPKIDVGTRASEARGWWGAGAYLGLKAGLVGETLETDLVEGIGGVAARSRDGGGRRSAGWFGMIAGSRRRRSVAAIPAEKKRSGGVVTRADAHLMSSRRKISLLE